MDTLEKHIGKNDHLLKTFGSEMKKIHDNLKEAQKDSKSAYKEIKCAFKEMTLRRDELEKKGKDALQDRTTCVSVKGIWSYSGY